MLGEYIAMWVGVCVIGLLCSVGEALELAARGSGTGRGWEVANTRGRLWRSA
jgi:hypothetical protein